MPLFGKKKITIILPLVTSSVSIMKTVETVFIS